MLRVVCRASNGRHDASRLVEGFYERYEHRWASTEGLRCRVCGAKMVPESDLTELEADE